jgi:hypothetical protein
MNYRRLTAAELDGVSDQVLKNLPQLVRIGHTTGKSSEVTIAPLSRTATSRLPNACLTTSVQSVFRAQALSGTAPLELVPVHYGNGKCPEVNNSEDSVPLG